MAAGTVLISGAGVAGPTLAYWLHRAGFEPTIVERAPKLRMGGYVIDFWGLGYDIAEAMGLSGSLERHGYHIREMRIVGNDGRRLSGFGTRVFDELTGGRFVSVRRSDLSRLLAECAAIQTEMIFDDTIESLLEDADGVRVRFAHQPPRRFDLVIGADGLHSRTRELKFGPQDQYEISLGYKVAAFDLTGYRPREDAVYLMYNEPGRMVGRVSLREDHTLFLFVFSDASADAPKQIDASDQKALLRDTYRGGGWETQQILDVLDNSDNLYFDRVSQIHLPAWSKGRVALVGDAAFCVSLMAGQGSALAMTAAYVLAGELGRPGASFSEAFERYERLLRPYIATKQKAAISFSSAFAPKTSLGIIVRNLVTSAMAIPGVARLTFGRDVVDKLELPAYSWTKE